MALFFKHVFCQTPLFNFALISRCFLLFYLVLIMTSTFFLSSDFGESANTFLSTLHTRRKEEDLSETTPDNYTTPFCYLYIFPPLDPEYTHHKVLPLLLWQVTICSVERFEMFRYSNKRLNKRGKCK